MPPRKNPASASTDPPRRSARNKRAAPPSDSEDDATKPTPVPAKPASKKAKTTSKAAPPPSTVSDDEPAKMVTVLKRGKAPVDPRSGKVDTHQVYADDTNVYDCMLNQTDVSGGSNKNKFYVIQLLHPTSSNSTVMLFTRWGRVGEDGQTQVKGPFNAVTGVQQFKAQFKAKAGVAWEQRVGMVPKKGKYVWLERDYADEEDEKQEKSSEEKKERAPTPDSTLETEVQDLCRLIFNTSLIDAHLSSMQYDARKLPLGKLSKATILNGFAALKKLADVINNNTHEGYSSVRQACEELSSAYYSIIPHDFGRQRGIVIDGVEKLKRELDLVDALGDMEVASKLISSSVLQDENGDPVNPLDSQFKSLGLTRMDPVARGQKEWNTLLAYVQNTHGQTHRFGVELMHAYRVERSAEEAAWKEAGFDSLASGERLLLWHGSRTTNFAGILKQGLRIAPPEAPVTGYMFGKGVYFADMMSKSANYCYARLSGNTGLLLLCEVAVSPFYERYNAEYNADQGCKSASKRSTKGIGRTQPSKWQDAGEALGNESLVGCHMPEGPCEQAADSNAYLQYNEYIVYDVSQIRLKYLLMVKM